MSLSTRTLFLVPPLVAYLASYLYLCTYHGTLVPFFTVIHEGGKLNFWQTVLYAPHFLGHIPVVATLAMWFSGIWLTLTEPARVARPSFERQVVETGCFLGATALLSWWVFGLDETMGFVLQQKQSEAVSGEGGAWTLHLPSTLLLFLLIPGYLLAAFRIMGRPLSISQRGLPLLGASLLFALLMTWAANDQPLQTVRRVWSAPRYLGHSVREILTFSVTYFPPALYFLFRETRAPSVRSRVVNGRTTQAALLALAIFLLGLSYQVWMTLQAGISELAQRPAFAEDGGLGVPYLLSTHYFEHFLDTVFFVLLCRLLTARSRRLSPD